MSDESRLIRGIASELGSLSLLTRRVVNYPLRGAASDIAWQFALTVGVTVAGVGKVNVAAGRVNLPRFGRVPRAAAVTDVTASGYIILRAAKSNGALTCINSATAPSVDNATFWEWSLGEVTFTAGIVTISMRNPGEKTVFTTI